jgi:hypothetical protein
MVLHIVVLPTPEGPDNTMSTPLLKVLYLLPDLLYLFFNLDDRFADFKAVCFDTAGVRLTLHFLQYEI